MTYHRQDRALCINDGSSALVRGRLYHVRACKMTATGEQTLNLVGFGIDDWYNASRFVRVADPAGRKWPAEPRSGYEDTP